MNLAAAVADLGEMLAASGVSVYSTVVGNGSFPAAVVGVPDEIRYSTTWGGKCDVDITVSIFVPAQDIPSGAIVLYRLLNAKAGDGTTSLVDLLSTQSSTFITRIQVNSADGFNLFNTKDGHQVLGANLNLTISL